MLVNVNMMRMTRTIAATTKQSDGDGRLCDIQVDLYRATAATWGILLLVRTGSKEHNVHLCNVAISKGFRLFYSQGLVKDGQVVAGQTEEEVFIALELPFIPPQDREISSQEIKAGHGKNDISCGHGSRWIWWPGSTGKGEWRQVIMASNCDCGEPPRP